MLQIRLPVSFYRPLPFWRALALAAGVVLVGLVCGLLVAQLPPLGALLVFAALTVFFVACRRPEVIILLMLTLTSSVLEPKIIPTFNLAFKFSAVEVTLMLLLGLVAFKTLAGPQKNSFQRTPLDLPVFLFFVASGVSFLNAWLNLGTDRGWLVPQWRVIFDYLVFFAVTNFVRTRQQFQTFTNWLLIIALITAVLMILQSTVGAAVRILPQVNLGAANVFESEYSGVTRVIVPGTPLVFMMLLPALLLYTSPGYRKAGRGVFLGISILLLLVAIGFTFDRFWWMGMSLSLILLIVVVSLRQRGMVVRRLGFLLLILIFSVLFLGLISPRTGEIVQVMGLRAGSLFGGEKLVNDASTQWRLREIDATVEKIEQHPLLGVGPGGPLREEWFKGDVLTRYIHNSYLFVLADLGIVGFLAFLWFSVACLVRGFRHWRDSTDPSLRAWTLGLTLAYVSLLVASISAAEFMEWHTAPLVGVVLGLNEVALRLGKSES